MNADFRVVRSIQPRADIVTLPMEGSCAVSAHLFQRKEKYGTARRPSLQNADFDEACANFGKGISLKFNNLRKSRKSAVKLFRLSLLPIFIP